MRLAVAASDARFKVRVAAIALHAGRVLLHRWEMDPFWALPGGTCELLETTSQTLARELSEEIGVQARVGRLVWVVENFFRYDRRDYHELGFYYRCSLPETHLWTAGCEQFEGSELFEDQSPPMRLLFQWFRVEELEQLPLYPQFLREGLKNLPDAVTHVVIREPGSGSQVYTEGVKH